MLKQCLREERRGEGGRESACQQQRARLCCGAPCSTGILPLMVWLLKSLRWPPLVPPLQVLQVSEPVELELDISGLTFSPSGRRLYVGTEEGISAFEVDTMERRGFPCAELC